MSKKTKIHFATIDRANESYNHDEWGRTLCGLEETIAEVEVSDKIEYVSCKKCLKAFPRYKKSTDNNNDYYE